MSDEDGRINMNGSRVCVDYLTFYISGVARNFFVRSVSVVFKRCSLKYKGLLDLS